MTPRQRGAIELAVAMTIVGSSFVAARVTTDHLPVFLGAGLRFGLATVVLVPILYRREGRLPRTDRRTLLVLLCQAFTGSFLFSVFLLWGLRYTTAAESGIIASTTPAVIALLAALLLRERLTGRVLAGGALAVGGGAVITTLGAALPAAGGSNPLLGNLLVFGAVIGEALLIIIGKSLGTRLSPLAIATYTIGFGFALFVPFAAVETAGFDAGAVPLIAWIALIYYALVVTVLGYLLVFAGLTRVPAGAAGVFTGLVPVSTLLLSYVLLGEPFRWTHLLGVAVVLTGIGLMMERRPRAGTFHPRLRPRLW